MDGSSGVRRSGGLVRAWSLHRTQRPSRFGWLLALALAALVAGLLAAVPPPAALAAPSGTIVVDPAWQPDGAVGGRVRAIVRQPDGRVVIGGWFAMVDGAPRNAVARLAADGTLDAGFAPSVTGEVHSIALQPDGKIVIGGRFDSVNGVARGGIARLNPDGTLDGTFDPGAGVTGLGRTVHEVALQSDGKVVLGGSFDKVGAVARANLARLQPTGAVDVGFNTGVGVNQEVRALLVQPDGKTVVGGSFTTVNGTVRRGIARLLSDGALDTTFDPGIGFTVGFNPGTVLDLARLSDGSLMVGGNFGLYNGIERRGIAKVSNTGALDAAFDPGGGFGRDMTMMPGLVAAVALQPDGKVVAGGDFTLVNGVERRRIARLNANGTLDLGFDPGTGIVGAPFNVGIDALLLLPDGKVLAGGLFEIFNGTGHNALMRLTANGAADAAFTTVLGAGVGFNGAVTDTALQPDGKVVVTGWFGVYNGGLSKGVARLNVDGTLDPTFNPGIGPAGQGTVNGVLLQPDGKIVVFGGFSTFAGISRPGIARLNPDGSLDGSFAPIGGDGNGAVEAAVLQPDGRIVVGGSFTSIAGGNHTGITRLNANGTLDQSFNPGYGVYSPSGPVVRALALQPDGRLIIGGDFTGVNGAFRNKIARLFPDGVVDGSFDPGYGFSSLVTSLDLTSDGRVVVGGTFTGFNYVPRNGIVRLDQGGGVDATFVVGTGFTGVEYGTYVLTVEVLPDDSVLVAGQFTHYDGTPRASIALLSRDGAVDSGFDPGGGFASTAVNAGVQGVASVTPLADGRIIVGGGFHGFDDAFPMPFNITRLLPPAQPAEAPTGLTAQPGDGQALVSFTPSGTHGLTILNYEFSVAGGGWVARAPASAVPAVTVPGLVNGVDHQVRVRAVTSAGPGVASAAVTVRPVAPVASVFVPTPPTRVVDSRVASGGAGPIPGGSARVLSVANALTGGGVVVPAGAVAVAYNLTVPNPSAAGHVRVMPGDAATVTSASAINFRAGETIANASVVRVDAARQVKIYAGTTADVIVDVVGYYLPSPDGGAAPMNGAAGRFTPVPPVRVYDAGADPLGPLQGGQGRVVNIGRTQADGTPIVPTGATAVAYNLTVVGTSGPGHLRVMPGYQGSTESSAINWSTAGERIANGSVIGVGPNREMRVFNGGGAPVRFLVDVVGYFSDSGAEFFAIDPVRTTDTRVALGGVGPVLPGARVVSVGATQAGAMVVVPPGASAVAFNATVVATGSVGHLRVFPADAALPTASVLNWPGARYTRANATAVAISPERQVTLYNGAGTPTDVLIDINGYYQ